MSFLHARVIQSWGRAVNQGRNPGAHPTRAGLVVGVGSGGGARNAPNLIDGFQGSYESSFDPDPPGKSVAASKPEGWPGPGVEPLSDKAHLSACKR